LQKVLNGLKTDLTEDLSKLGTEIKLEHGRLKLHARTLTKDQAFDLLRQEGALTERISRIIKEVGWLKDLLPASFIATLSNEQKEAQRHVARISPKTKKIDEGIFAKSEIESSVRRMNEQLERLKSRAKERIDDKESAIKKSGDLISKLGFTPSQRIRLRELKTRLGQIAVSVKEYDAMQRKLEKWPDQGPLIENLKTRIKELGVQLASFTAREKQLRPEEEKYSDGLEAHRSLEKSMGDIKGELGKAEGEMNILKKRVEDLEGLGPIIKEMEQGIRSLEVDEEVFTVLKQDVFHRKGILLFAINQLLEGISIEASKILGDLTDERLNKIRLTPTAEVRGGSVGIEVEAVDGLFRDVSEFSGGEKTQVNAALRFAISKELASMPQIGKAYGNMKTLFIDEGDLGSLDTSNARVLFVKKLLSMGNLFERVVLITHIAEVADQFPSRIRVYMTPENFSRVTVGEISA
jgi:exonuclease SbcC